MEEKAHSYVSQGLKVIPIKAGTKVPLTPHGSLDATDDHEIIHAWWQRWPSANIGIATGYGVDVIDLDGWEAQQQFEMIKDTPEILGAVMTPRDGGLHLYVPVTGKGNRTGIKPGIDYRGKGGYVLAPPSMIIPNGEQDYGGEYEWIDDLDLARIPNTQGKEWMPEKQSTERVNGAQVATNHARHSTPDDHKEDDQVRSYLNSAIAQETTAILQASKGNRNHVLNTSAFSLGQLVPHYLDAVETKQLLIDAAKKTGLPLPEIIRTVDHAISDGSKQPREPQFHDLKVDVRDVDLEEWLQDHPGLENDHEDVAYLEGIWALRPELEHIQQFALSRLVSPWAVLGVSIMRVLTSVPPWVMLPAFIGGKGNLNAMLSLVGPSGTGKDAAVRCGLDAFKIMQNGFEYKVRMLPIGTGEGMLDQFATIQMLDDGSGTKVPTQVANDDPKVLFSALEVNMIKTLTSRSGATLIEILKMAFSGSQIGFTYRNKGQGSVIINADDYRLCMIIGAQPENIEPLLDDDLGGFPQRLVWLPSTDSSISADYPDEPEPWIIEDQKWPLSGVDLVIPDEIKQIIINERVERMKGTYEGDLEGHYRYVQLKVASGLMIIAGRRMMIMEDWTIADMIMRKSLHTRDAARRMITKKHEKKKIAAHKDAATRVVYEEKARYQESAKQEQSKHDQTKGKIKSLLRDGPMRTTALRDAVRTKLYKECLGDLIADHEVITGKRDGQRGIWAWLS